MRRTRMMVLLAGLLSLLVGPITTAAQAQVPPDDVNVVALVTGQTDPDAFEDEHSLGLNRVTGPSRFVEGGFQIAAVVSCPNDTAVPAVAALDAPGHPVTFWADDDVTDGYGEISATDSTRAFKGGDIEVRIDEGRFHRLGGIVEVDLELDVRVAGVCHDDNVPFRIVFELLPDVRTPETPTEGFLLVGVGSRHGVVDGDRTSVARTICDEVPDTRLSDEQQAQVNEATGIEGRGNFHPCAADG